MKYTGINNYYIDEFGVVLNKKTGKNIKPSFNKKNGYLRVCLSDNGKILYFYVHRLVSRCYNSLSEFIGADVNHRDGNKLNNHYLNLEWCTRKQNIAHSFKLGLSNTQGERNSQSKLNSVHVIVIREAVKLGHKRNDIASYFNVHPDTIRHIENGKNWKHV